MSDRRWSLPSNRGMELLECEVVGNADRDMVCRFTIVGEYWSRGQKGTRDVVEDFRVVLPQVIVAREALGALAQAFADWMKEERSFSCVLQSADRAGQAIEVSLGEDPRFVRSTHKAVFNFSYCSGLVMASRFSFVVDQSCVRTAMEGLSGCVIDASPRLAT